MKIALMDDIHLEFGQYNGPLPDADILVLAGDICVAAHLQEHKTDADSRSHRKNVTNFFETVSQKYEHVLYVMGNHEHYRGVFENTVHILREFLTPWPNVRLLEKDTFVYQDVLFYGATFWTSCDNKNPMVCNHLRGYMNDFYGSIRHEDRSLFTPEESADIHESTVKDLKAILNSKAAANKKIVVISHHAPDPRSIDYRFKDEILGNCGYYSNLEPILGDPIVYWFHGHVHVAKDYDAYGTRVVANPWGYPIERYRNIVKENDYARVFEL